MALHSLAKIYGTTPSELLKKDIWDLSLDAAAAVVGTDEEKRQIDRAKREHGNR